MSEEDQYKIKPELASILYTEVCNNIRTTDEISFKLLGLVPLISGAGIFGISIDVFRSDEKIVEMLFIYKGLYNTINFR